MAPLGSQDCLALELYSIGSDQRRVSRVQKTPRAHTPVQKTPRAHT